MEDNPQSDNCGWMSGHKTEQLSKVTDMKVEVYHKAAEEELKFFHMRMSGH